ncbi:hypothetical protein B0H13DRAFT_1871585 [Mycena leptocephala]|nr:hypothetical protein B0H13DRAFT_1871585 [Mycena leptocephala]
MSADGKKQLKLCVLPCSHYIDARAGGPIAAHPALPSLSTPFRNRQQALTILAQDTDISSPLSQERIELLTRIFGESSQSREQYSVAQQIPRYKYVSVLTKVKVLQYFAVRAEYLLDARAIIDSRGLDVEMLDSNDHRILRGACSLIAQLSSHHALVASVVALSPILRSTDDDAIRQYAIQSSCGIVRWCEACARHTVAYGILENITEHLDSPDSDVVEWSQSGAASWDTSESCSTQI